MTSTVTIHIRQSKTRWPLRRPQRWYWVAINNGNHRTLAQSSEMYTNETDAVTAAEQLFSNSTDLLLSRPGHHTRALRAF